MKRLGLLAIIGCSVSGVAIAAGVDCNVIPTCAEMGFDKTVAECGESKVLRCPFDLTNDDAVFCNSGCTTGSGCDEDFNLDACPEGGICSDCGEKYELVVCETGYTRDGDTCCSGTGFKFETCPTNGQCTLCGTKYKLNTCDVGFTMTESECCSDETYNLASCPENGVCTSCGVKYNFGSCNSGYTKAENICCSDATYNLDACPDNGVCTSCGAKYNFSKCNSGYTKAGTVCCSNTTYSLSSCPTNAASCTQCGSKYKVNSCKTGYTGADCSSCASGYKQSGSSCVKCYNSCVEAGYNMGQGIDTLPPDECVDTNGDGYFDICAMITYLTPCNGNFMWCVVRTFRP